MKVLFLVPYPRKGASNRVRIEQYLPYLKANNVYFKIRPFLSSGFFEIIYLRNHWVEKILNFIVCTLSRMADLLSALWYDIIFIHREAFPLGFPFIEKLLYLFGKRIIFDFDDAIFLLNSSETNSVIKRFKRPDKIKEIIKISRAVIAGNDYLKDFALKYNNKVFVVPSSIDTNLYRPKCVKEARGNIVIGWIGSSTTACFLGELQNVILQLEEKYSNLEFRFIGGKYPFKRLKKVFFYEWLLEDEIERLQDFDIGVMPMPDNEWTKGKCGYKAILYMAAGIPCVCSPVGVNKEIIKDGLNGFLADKEDEWVMKLSNLIEHSEIRKRLGSEGRKTVEEKYSVSANAPKILKIINDVFEKNNPIK